MIEHKLIRVAPNDPERCQGSFVNGQCPYRAVPGTQYCPRCGGPSQEKMLKQASIRNYRLSQWQGRVNEFADNAQAKSLREEIGILRMTLESILNRCHEDNDIFLYAGRISDMTLKIEKVVSTCDRLEKNSGQLLDKTKALNFAATVVEIISKHINDSEILDQISNEIITALALQQTVNDE